MNRNTEYEHTIEFFQKNNRVHQAALWRLFLLLYKVEVYNIVEHQQPVYSRHYVLRILNIAVAPYHE